MSGLLDRLAWFGTPVAVTVLLHALVLAALLVRWSNPTTIEARAPKPVAIQAKLVSADDLKPKKKPVVRPQSKPKPKPKQETPRPTPKPEPKVKTKKAPEVVKPEPTPPPKDEPEPAPKLTQEQLAVLTLQEMESAIEADRQSQAGPKGTMRDTVAAIIQQAVIGRWTRPPSARNGMRAVLEIALVPTGDVVGVSVLTSSGDTAFDRSAINAVEKAARFPEVKQLERVVFERDFRRFQLIFRPEDLRY